MKTQFSVRQLSSTASNSLLSPHSHGVPASLTVTQVQYCHLTLGWPLDWMYNHGYNTYIHTSHTGYHQPILMTHHYCTCTCYHVQQQQLKETMATTRKTSSHNHSMFLGQFLSTA